MRPRIAVAGFQHETNTFAPIPTRFEDFDLVPILWAGAEPGDDVADTAFDRIAGMICDAIARAGRLDGVYLDLHGAMVTESHEDGEGVLLRRVRAVHFLADYEPIAEAVIFAEAPGASPCELDRIPYRRLRPGVRLGPNGPAFDPERPAK